MKKILILFALAMLALSGIAQKSAREMPTAFNTNEDKYCVTVKDSQSIITLNNKPVTIDIPLADGSILSPNGVLLKKNGTKVTLRNGECIDPKGKILARPLPLNKGKKQGGS